jgi:hypothetical protein
MRACIIISKRVVERTNIPHPISFFGLIISGEIVQDFLFWMHPACSEFCQPFYQSPRCISIICQTSYQVLPDDFYCNPTAFCPSIPFYTDEITNIRRSLDFLRF